MQYIFGKFAGQTHAHIAHEMGITSDEVTQSLELINKLCEGSASINVYTHRLKQSKLVKLKTNNTGNVITVVMQDSEKWEFKVYHNRMEWMKDLVHVTSHALGMHSDWLLDVTAIRIILEDHGILDLVTQIQRECKSDNGRVAKKHNHEVKRNLKNIQPWIRKLIQLGLAEETIRQAMNEMINEEVVSYVQGS